MTAPAPAASRATANSSVRNPDSQGPQPSSVTGVTGRPRPFGEPTPPDHRTTALQSAVAVLRGKPQVKTKDVLEMAEAFHEFLKRGK